MSDYTRTTRECAPAQLKPELLEAIRAHAAQHELGNVEADSRLCVEAAPRAVPSSRLPAYAMLRSQPLNLSSSPTLAWKCKAG
jgi:hypothetical protein